MTKKGVVAKTLVTGTRVVTEPRAATMEALDVKNAAISRAATTTADVVIGDTLRTTVLDGDVDVSNYSSNRAWSRQPRPL